MKALHAQVLPDIEFKDASLAVQSEKAATMIYNILHKFQVTQDPGVLMVHDPRTAVNPDEYPDDFQDGANNLTERREKYADEGIALADGFERDLKGFVQSVPTKPAGEAGAEAAGETPSGESGE